MTKKISPALDRALDLLQEAREGIRLLMRLLKLSMKRSINSCIGRHLTFDQSMRLGS